MKLAVLDRDLTVLDESDIDAAPDSDEVAEGLGEFLDRAPEVAAVGHRIVHGGPRLSAHQVIDAQVRSALDEARSLAPQHVPPALAALDLCRRRLPETVQVACLDTVFHTGLPEAARTYAVPREWRNDHGVRRYGFHGLSYAWTLARTAELLSRDPADLQVVLTHLGGGSSVCAVRGGRSVWTSMGFTPLEGLPMSHRSGSVDPGMLLWLQKEKGMSADEVSDALEHRSGLLGLSDGLSGDTRELVRAAGAGHRPASLALEVFGLRVRQEIAAAAASLDRLDAVVFSGEIGADQPEVRELVAAGLPVLSVHGGLDTSQDEDHVISRGGVPVLVVRPDEQRQLAIEVRRVLEESGGRPAGPAQQTTPAGAVGTTPGGTPDDGQHFS
ncbi:acetate/propionate family kinase [Nakamurella alba]|uniref:acetate/propionate family kinase n=1 Tax=Nakamurella alba TaxID=2665158 RepID=UPI001E4EEEDD|nr:acetate kinase [Nakamurella alba]